MKPDWKQILKILIAVLTARRRHRHSLLRGIMDN